MTEIICKTLYPYNGLGGEKITTLDFEAGEVIRVIFSGDAGWWEGEKNGIRGWFPASYVQRLEDETETDAGCWEEVLDDDGATYYVNSKTNETSWELPESMVANEPDAAEVATEVTAVNPTNNTNGNCLHLSLPLTEDKEALKIDTEAITPVAQEKEVSTPKSDINPITTKPSPILQRSHTFSNPSNRFSETGQEEQKPATRLKLVNGVSFPDEIAAKEQELLQPGNYSYCDYFWSDTSENNNYQSGFFLLYQKLLKEKQICKEMSDFVKAREGIEIQYAKSLAALSSSVLASQEEGTLGEAWKQLKAAMLLESKIHNDFATKLRVEVMQSLLAEKEKERKEMKKLEATIAELRKQVNFKYHAAEKTRQHLIEKTKDYDIKNNSLKYTKDDVLKARRKSAKYAEELVHAVELYNKHRQQWFEEMVTSTLVLEKHETERIHNVKSIIGKYSSLLRLASTGSGETCDIISEQLKQVDVDKDREMWVKKNTTGSIRPVDLVI